MHRKLMAIVAVAILATLLGPPLAAQAEFTGTTAGGAHYKIAVPDGWASGDGLVIWNHGFSLSPIGPVDDLGPLAELQLAQGFAVAASSYRQTGWALFKSSKDLRALVSAFKGHAGAPGPIILTGASLGGAVTVAALEQAKIADVVAAYTFCGAVAGSRNWDGAFDIRLLYDAVCRDVPDAAIAGGRTGLEKSNALGPSDVASSVNACTGVDLPKRRRSKEQKENLARLLALTGLPEGFLQTDMWYVTFGMSNLFYDRGKLRGKQALGNENVDYGDAAVDASIERVKARKGPARRLARNFTPKGKIGDVKIVNLHTDKDGLVIVENQSEYASVVPAENLTVAVAVEKQPSHCGFSVAEVAAGWDATTNWAAGGAQPTVAEMQATCEALAGIFGGPCRFDPDFVIPDMDGRVRPR